MTKAQEMAQRQKEGNPNWWLDSTEQAQAYLVFDDGSVLDAWDGEPCTFEMRDRKVHAVVFEDEFSDQPENVSSERRRKELALARLLVVAVELIRNTGDSDLDTCCAASARSRFAATTLSTIASESHNSRVTASFIWREKKSGWAAKNRHEWW